MQRFTSLRVWRESHAFLLAIYRVTGQLPNEEKYGLTSQLRRAALSVPTNVVEGAKRIGKNDYARFLNLAEASLAEAEYLLVVTHDLGYLAAQAVDPLVRRAKKVARKLHALREAVTHFGDEDPSASTEAEDPRRSETESAATSARSLASCRDRSRRAP